MDWLSALGGIGRGVTGGTQDLREMQNEALRREMMKQEMNLRQQTIDENQHRVDTRNKLKGIRKPGDTTYQDDLQEAGAGSAQARALEEQTKDFGQEGATKTKEALGGKGIAKGRKVTQGDQMRDASDVYAGQGELDKSMAATNAARSSDQADLSDQTMAKYRQLMPMVQQDPVGFLSQYAPEWYKTMVPDGHTAVTASTPQGMQISLYDDKRNTVVHQRMIPSAQIATAAKDVLEKMYLFDMGLISPEAFKASFEMGMKKRQANAQETTANAAMLNARTNSELKEEQSRTGNWGQSTYYDRLGRAALERSGREPKGHAPAWAPVGQTDTGEQVLFDRTSGTFKVDPQSANLFPKATGAKPRPEVPAQMQQAFAQELRETGTDPKAIDAVMKKWERLYPGISGQASKPDPIIEALKNAPPPERGKKGVQNASQTKSKESDMDRAKRAISETKDAMNKDQAKKQLGIDLKKYLEKG